MPFCIPSSQPYQHEYNNQSFDKTKTCYHWELQAVLDQCDQLSHRLEDGIKDEDVLRQTKCDRIHDADEKQEHHFTHLHTISNVIEGIQEGAKKNGWDHPKGLLEA